MRVHVVAVFIVSAILLSACGLKVPSQINLPTEVTGGEPQTLEAATKAAQEWIDRRAARDYVGVWLMYDQQIQDGISQADYVTLSQTCESGLTRIPVTVTGVRMVDGTHAIVRAKPLGFSVELPVVYENGKWLIAPTDDFAAELGKPLGDIIAGRKAAGRCGNSPVAATPSAPPKPPAQGPPIPSSSPVPYTPRPAPAGDPASNIDYLLLLPSEVRSIVGGPNEFSRNGNLAAGPSDDTALVQPPTCVGVIFTAEQSVYGGTGFTAMRTETLHEAAGDTWSDLVQQTVAVFPTQDQAQALMTSSEAQWRECARGNVSYKVPGTNGEVGWKFNLGEVKVSNDVLTVSMAGINRESGNSACQQAVGIRANVIVSVRRCSGKIDIPINATVPDPNLAGNYAERLAVAILARIR